MVHKLEIKNENRALFLIQIHVIWYPYNSEVAYTKYFVKIVC